MKIYKDSKIVDIMVAQAKNERLDSAVAEQASNLIKE